MTRQLFLILSLMIMSLSSANAFALGVGEAYVNSSLNQPLVAEIELRSVGDLTEAEILPALATREEFARAGVDRVHFLSDLRFKVVRKPAGKFVVELTTKKSVREPYLNFLVEIIWPSGRLIREYSLLIDPPVFSEQPAAPVRAPSVSSSTDSLSQPQQVARDEQIVRGDQVSLRSAPVSVGAAVGGSLQAGTQYGPIRSDETLWDIAEKARPDRSVSPQQVMLAIQDANPEAFIGSNINKLKEGVVLRLPSKEQMTTRSQYNAINEVIAQNEALLPARSKSVVSTASSAASDAAQRRSDSTPRDELKLVVGSGGASQSSSASSGSSQGGSGLVSKEELVLTLEKLDQAVSEKKELSGRVSDLEEQLGTLQRLLTLKNDQLASLQEQMRANAAAEASAAASSEPSLAGVSDQALVAADEVVGQENASQPVSGELPGGGDVQAPEVTDAVSVSDVKMPVVKESPPVAEKTVTPRQVQKEKSFVESLFTDPLYMAGASVVVLIVMILVWLASRNNARKEESMRAAALDEQSDLFDENTQVPASGFSDQDNDAFAFAQDEQNAAPDTFDEVDSGFDQDAEKPDASEAKSSDVVAEADVYIAYGRLDRAAEILEKAIAAEPLRTELRLKLLEVYKESGSRDEFERQYSELEAIQNVSALAAANALRIELYDRELLSLDDSDFVSSGSEGKIKAVSPSTSYEAEDELAAQDANAELEREVLDSFDFDQPELDEAAESEVEFDAEDIDLDIDVSNEFEDDRDESFETELALDLGDEFETEPRLDVADSELDIDLESANDFELSDDLAELDAESVDLDLSDDLSDIELSDELEQEKEIDIPDDLSIPADLMEQPETVSRARVKSTPVVSDEILEEAEEAFKDVGDLEAGLGDDEEFDFLEGADEASTKLDLARAYIDMGDLDGARDILEEVFKEGNADQQKEAKALLGELEE